MWHRRFEVTRRVRVTESVDQPPLVGRIQLRSPQRLRDGCDILCRQQIKSCARLERGKVQAGLQVQEPRAHSHRRGLLPRGADASDGVLPVVPQGRGRGAVHIDPEFANNKSQCNTKLRRVDVCSRVTPARSPHDGAVGRLATRTPPLSGMAGSGPCSRAFAGG
ncbi:hypothetical protein T484DRAFT_1909986, partial [Baffinella frigidus]